MDWLKDLVHTLRKEEVRAFKLFAQRTMREADRLDLALFDGIRANDAQTVEKHLIEQKYQGNRNAYYRLRHRLAEDILQSQLVLHFKDDEATAASNWLTLANLYVKRGEFSLSIKLLEKAEKSAAAADDFQVLDAVYSLFLRLSQEPNLGLDPQPYVELRRINQLKLAHIQKLEEVVAIATHRLNTAQNYAPTTQEVQQWLTEVTQHPSTVPAVSQSPSYRVKVYEAVSRLLVQLRDYASLETYLRETYQQFEQEGLFAKTAPEMRFNMLTYLINTLYFSEKYQSSLEYAHVLGQWLQEYTGPSLMKYRFFYHNSLVINYSKLDPRRAIAELEPLRADSLWQAEPYYRLFVSSNLVLLFFNTRQFPKAMRELARLYTDDRYPSLDEALRFRLQLTELFIRYETEELELLLKQHERLSKQFAHLLLPHTREAALLDGLLLLARADTPKARKKAKPKLAALVAQLAGEVKPETDLLDFHEWFSRRL